MYFVYIIRCTDNSLYAGTARDVSKRLKEHFGKSEKRAKYTKSHDPLRLEAVWQCQTKSDALKLEYRLKELSKAQKEKLIKDNVAPESICIKLSGLTFDRLNVNEIDV